MDKPNEDDRKKYLSYVAVGCICILFYVFLTHLDRVAAGFRTLGYFVYPVFMGLVIAYVLSPLVKMFQEKVFWVIKSPAVNRNVSVMVVFILIILLVLLTAVGLIPQLVTSVVNLIQNLDTYTESIKTGLGSVKEFAARFDFDISETVDSISSAVQNLTSLLGANANRILSTSFSVGMGVFNFIVAFVLAFYFLFDKFPFQQNNHRFFRAVLSPKVFDNAVQFLSQCNAIIMRYIISELLDALIVGVSNMVFMMIMKMPYVALISVVVGVTNLAPTFGPIVGGAIGGLILLLVNPWDALAFLIFTIALQTVDGYVIKPKLFGDMLGISSVWILASIIIGGRVLGVLGILVAIPLAAIIGLGYRDYLLPSLEKWRANLNQQKQEKESRMSEGGENTPDEDRETDLTDDNLTDDVQAQLQKALREAFDEEKA